MAAARSDFCCPNEKRPSGRFLLFAGFCFVGVFRLGTGAYRLASSLASLAKSASPADTRTKAASVETSGY
jgi:hypothetical protein